MSKDYRYDRQIVLPEIGLQGQEKISGASVLCVGAGGLGCPALLYLVAAGVGRIGIVDFDKIDETNLQRQVLFTVDQIGSNKAEAAKERLSALNPDIQIEAHPIELTNDNIETIFENFNIIIDGTDNLAAKFLINDAVVKTGKPFVYGSILGFDGQLAVFNYNGGPCYRCLFPKIPRGHIPNCAEAGVIGAVAGMIGAAQAMEAIKIITGHENFQPLSGKIWAIDMRNMENRLLSLSKNPDCPVCSKTRKDIVLQYASPVFDFIQEVTPQQARGNKEALLIDVRENEEWNKGHIEKARHIPLSVMMHEEIPDLPTDCEIILHCQRGKRGQQAVQILKAKGYLHVSNMAGGYEAWLKCS